jgi:hypothetical protein
MNRPGTAFIPRPYAGASEVNWEASSVSDRTFFLGFTFLGHRVLARRYVARLQRLSSGYHRRTASCADKGAPSASDRLFVTSTCAQCKKPARGGLFCQTQRKLIVRTEYRRPFRRNHRLRARSDGLRRQRYRRPPDVHPLQHLG